MTVLADVSVPKSGGEMPESVTRFHLAPFVDAHVGIMGLFTGSVYSAM